MVQSEEGRRIMEWWRDPFGLGCVTRCTGVGGALWGRKEIRREAGLCAWWVGETGDRTHNPVPEGRIE